MNFFSLKGAPKGETSGAGRPAGGSTPRGGHEGVSSRGVPRGAAVDEEDDSGSENGEGFFFFTFPFPCGS